MENTITPKKATVELTKGFDKAEKTLQNVDKLEKLLQRAEKCLKSLPKVGEKLSHIPSFISLVKSYIKKEYTAVPVGTIIAIISAITYVVSPVDLIPDLLPGVGHIDDAAIVAACLILVDEDVKEFLKWRKETGRDIE